MDLPDPLGYGDMIHSSRGSVGAFEGGIAKRLSPHVLFAGLCGDTPVRAAKGRDDVPVHRDVAGRLHRDPRHEGAVGGVPACRRAGAAVGWLGTRTSREIRGMLAFSKQRRVRW